MNTNEIEIMFYATKLQEVLAKEIEIQSSFSHSYLERYYSNTKTVVEQMLERMED